jgi:RNA polymerase sigma-70 factor, ECF subfamily
MRSAQPGREARRPEAASAELLEALMASVLAGDEEAVLKLLDPDVVLISDAGPARRAARVPIVGAKRVQQHAMKVWSLLGLAASPNRQPAVRILQVNSSPSLVLETVKGPIVVTGEAIDGRIASIWIRLNPDKNAAFKDHPSPIV